MQVVIFFALVVCANISRAIAAPEPSENKLDDLYPEIKKAEITGLFPHPRIGRRSMPQENEYPVCAYIPDTDKTAPNSAMLLYPFQRIGRSTSERAATRLQPHSPMRFFDYDQRPYA